ncbi:uncharacterized protein LOC111008874 isoform X2 [Momordica charantia]|uniref:Uncharacterized protein LOC111008874 isoform X2 n=1 Tax=Momordica charantia TaxID=3673 RepID=A0A6J1CAB3_MOMCH|nr:uncharacterized protein LOC111008874 isoform X2 [Momordica charantia]
MAGDLSNPFASPEERPKALISCPSASTKSGIQHESAEGKFPENQLPEDDNPSSICVICFSDDGKAERGKLDSCDHYFCFVCIMEWARIESRCPACKGRFTAVHRIPKDGCRIRERIVNIPMRNQDQSATGNDMNGPHDPYAETYCTVCKGVEDEGLMLLCDLCDSAAHTYCVGLGANVPEGDWFCHDCTLSRAQHADTEMDASGNDQNQIATVEAHISISDLVKESSAETVGMPSRRAPLHSNREQPSIVPSWRSSVAKKSFPSRGGKGAGTSARTLHRCRNIHGHIRALRENWGALRRGSLSFPSSSSSYGGNSSKQVIGAALSNNQTGQPHFSTAKSSQQASGPECNESSYDVEKAWRMMEIAKAKAIREGDQSLRYPASRQIGGIEVKDSHTAKGQQHKIKKLQELTKDKKEMGKHRSPELDEQLCRPVAIKKNKASNGFFPASASSYGETSLGNVVQPRRGDSIYENGRNPSNKIRVDEVSSSSRTIQPSEKGHAAGETHNNHDAKNEIRTLVKINLKLLSRDKNLDLCRI